MKLPRKLSGNQRDGMIPVQSVLSCRVGFRFKFLSTDALCDIVVQKRCLGIPEIALFEMEVSVWHQAAPSHQEGPISSSHLISVPMISVILASGGPLPSWSHGGWDAQL